MRRLTSWLLVAVMLISCFAGMALPAAATGDALVNLYDDATEGSCARADTVSTSQTKSLPTPYLLGSTEYVTTEPITVAAGDTLYFGPANAGQGYQGVFYPAAGGNGTQFSASNCTKVFSFDGTLCTASSASSADKTVALYSYTATAAGTVRLTFPQEYHDIFVVTKNQPMTYDSYYAHIDGITNRNLWNYYTGLKNLIKEDGTVNPNNANHYATHYIAVEEGDTITWGPHRNPTGMFYGAVGYNAEKVGVTGAIAVDETRMSEGVKLEGTFSAENRPNTADAAANTYGIYTYTVPAGVSYVRVLLRKEVADRFIVQKNNPFDVEEYWELMGGDMNSPLFGGDVLWLGDSIGQAAQDLKVNDVDLDGWVGRVSKSLNMNWTNNSQSGWSLGTGRLDGSNNRIVGRLFDGLDTEPETGYDLVMLHGGTNDAWSSSPVGEMTDSFYPGDFDVDTYTGALEELFYYATTLYGDTAEIAYILNFKMADRTNAGKVHDMDANYAEALEVCEKWGVTPIDLYHNDTVNSVLDTVTLFAFSDFVHPGRRGYDYLSPIITDGLIAAANGVAWGVDEATVADAITADLKEGVAADAHFTAASKTTFDATAAAAEGTAWDKLETVGLAAHSLVQEKDNRVSINDMTKYWFIDPTELAVSSAKDLKALANYMHVEGRNAPDGYIDDDITIYQTQDINIGSGISLGKASGTPFRANYDGQGHAITGFTSSSTVGYGSALFPYIESATIRNLTISGANCTGVNWAGILVGGASGVGNLIENVHIKDSRLSKTTGNGMAAILVQPGNTGVNSTDTYLIKDCTVSNTVFNVSAAENVWVSNIGFIASRAVTDNHVIENCYAYNNTINVNAAINMGSTAGILGEAYDGVVRNSGVYNNVINNIGNATLGESTIAAVVGRVTDGYTLIISGSYGDSADLPLAGGGGTIEATDCYSVAAGTTTVAEITGNALAAKLNAATDLHWASTPVTETLSLPMINEALIANRMIELGDTAFYTNSTDGKISATPDELAAVEGKIWRKGNTTLLTKDVLKGVFEDEESWYEVEYLLGDCIDSDTLDTADAAAILKALVNKPVEGYVAERADANADGRVSVADVTRVLRYVLRGQNAA